LYFFCNCVRVTKYVRRDGKNIKEKTKSIQNLVGPYKDKKPLVRLYVDGKIILKCIFMNQLEKDIRMCFCDESYALLLLKEETATCS
jgi:hypothetical protein